MTDILSTLKNASQKPYIYKVTNYENHQYYIGSQCSGKTIGVNYFTSSTNKAFKDGFKNYGEEKYEITIIKEFEDPKECVRAENYIIRNYMQKKDGLCLNRFYCCNGEKIFSRVGIPCSEETKKRIGEANKGKHLSEKTKQKVSWALQGHPCSEKTRKRIGEANKGKHLSEKTKQKIGEAQKGLPSPTRIKISIEGNVFDSLTEAAQYHNVSITAIRKWAKNKKHNAVYIK